MTKQQSDKMQEQLNNMSATIEFDYLTGIANRRGLHDYYESLDKESIVHAMFIDVDNFKRVNDVYGHGLGDELLICISHLIQKNVDGFTSRIGGDEYVVIMDGSMTQNEMTDIAQSMLDGMQQIDYRKDILSLVSLSIGIVLEQPVSQPLEDMLYCCDAAMYQAKHGGKNQYMVYKAHDKSIQMRKNIEMEMEDALVNGEFQVYLQPKVNMISSKLYGAEALSRWIHPKDGLRMPDLYIPIFEKNGFISQLDFYIFEQVCRVKASWKGNKYAGIPISVNMSRLHLYDEQFVDKLLEIANRYGVKPSELEIEIAENVFVLDSMELIKMVGLLKKHGFLVSIDDFGSGLSAMSLFKSLPVDTIKIDREFLTESIDDECGRTVIRNLISLFKQLKLDVIVEGIVTKEQMDFVTSCGCLVAQGFYYAKPLPVEEFEGFAEEYIVHTASSYMFRLNGNLQSEDGSMEGTMIGEGLEYQEGLYPDTKSMYFPGGQSMENVIQIPKKALVSDSYTIALWIKPEALHLWCCSLYMKFELGFAAILPLAWERHSDFRIRDSRGETGWYDTYAQQLPENVWSHFTIMYNAKTETAVTCINGEVIGTLQGVPANHNVKQIILGGDIFQPSFKGNMCDLIIYNEAMDYDFVRKLYESYIEKEGFTKEHNKN